MASKVATALCAVLAAWMVVTAAKEPPKPPQAASAPASQAATRQGNAPIESGSYVNSSGARIHVPAHTADGSMPAGASAHCRDGTYSFSAHRRGTCSHHGGVAQWL
jgi:hypothetical protein